ncbi:DNA gyrase subunit A [Candidatus Woesebacteria bacterium]|nr:MAG: DNA gyrase subunit A [Candidatus Woesebacteria bacterium]
MDIGKVEIVPITRELSKSYVDYAMSVIVSRALPDVRDGLKPVHRRILFAMNKMGLVPGKAFSKSAKVVGEVLGKYHPHSDTSVYDAMVRLAQDFSMRYPLVDGQGNFGSIDGDPPAAMRYTEARLSKYAPKLLEDINKETVEFTNNFDATEKEPVYLPALLPNLLLMGSEGIAVGMATKIPPHNLKEVVDAIILTIEKGHVIFEKDTQQTEASFVLKKIDLIASGEQKDFVEKETNPASISFESDVTVEDLVGIIPGPDFPTAGTIYDGNSIKDVYATGRGRIVVRGVAEIEEGAKGKQQIIISELPYQVNKAQLVEKIADLVRDKKIKGIADLRDESDKDGLRVAIDLKRDGRPKSILNRLYKYTKLQTTFSANFVALVDGTPHTVNLKQILVEYVKHRQKVIVRRTIFDLTQAKKRAHILEGLKIALDNLDAVIKTIRESKTQEEAKLNLMTRFKLTDIQSTAILDMQLRRLAALERQKIEEEYEEIKKLIDRLTAILRNPERVLDIIVEEITDLKEKFGDKRLTKIYKQAIGDFSEEDLIPKEETLITITKTGYVKRVPRNTYKSQRRGGKGVIGMTTKEEDEIEHIYSATTHDDLLFFTDKGKVYGTKAWDIPDSSRQGKGQALVNFLNLEQGENVLSILPIGSESKIKYLIMATSNGIVKKTSIKDFKNMRTSGLIAMRLKGTDKLAHVRETYGDDHILLISKQGKSIRFPEANVRSMGRATTGVAGIKLSPNDHVITMEVFPGQIKENKDKRRKTYRDMVIISERGLGKRTGIHLFPVQKRAGKGVKASVINTKTGALACATMVNEEIDMIVVTSKSGQVIKLPSKNIPQMGRITQGVILMRFAKASDSVTGVTALKKSIDDEDEEIKKQ